MIVLVEVANAFYSAYKFFFSLLSSQVPENYIEDFTSVRKFKFFNTNNLWVNLKAMAKLLVEKRISMELIVNPKTVNKSIPVVQLEEAAGAAIHNFDKPRGLSRPLLSVIIFILFSPLFVF